MLLHLETENKFQQWTRHGRAPWLWINWHSLGTQNIHAQYHNIKFWFRRFNLYILSLLCDSRTQAHMNYHVHSDLFLPPEISCNTKGELRVKSWQTRKSLEFAYQCSVFRQFVLHLPIIRCSQIGIKVLIYCIIIIPLGGLQGNISPSYNKRTADTPILLSSHFKVVET